LTRPSVVVGGSLAQRPGFGGHAWALLQYPLAFRKLGYDVLFVDQLTLDMVAEQRAVRSRCAAWFLETMKAAGLRDSCALLAETEEDAVGLARPRLLQRFREAEFVLNIAGFITDEELLGAARRRVFLDIDPGFLQMWRELDLADTLRGHDDFVTIAANMGSSRCTVPDCGLEWITTRPPVELSAWRPSGEGDRGFTTVASWRGPYAPVRYRGESYGLRVHEFRRFADLPRRSGYRFEAALDIAPADHRDVDLLRAGGWTIVDPRRHAGTLDGYQRYIAHSAAELMVAKEMYVKTMSGWFSDRSACYLASGKPVLAQETGFSRHYPVGEGLLAFSDPDEAVERAREVSENRDHHSRAARAIAEEHLDGRKVVGQLVVDLGVE
jgi:hypothetical protein